MKYGVRAKWLSRKATGQSETENVTEDTAVAVPLEQEVDAVPETVMEAELPAAPVEQADAVTDTDGSDPSPVAEATEEDELARQAAVVSQKYAGFDLAVERKDPRFVGMLQAGVPMLDAYRALHMDTILSDWSEQVRSEAEKRITDHVQARGVRPSENGTVRSGGLQLWQNVHQLTREKRAEIADRARNGESISFR